jgi:parallel beta-helix repeat protein
MTNKANPKTLLIVSVLFVAVHCATAVGRPIYVDANAPPGGDGASWGTAYNYLQDALTDANSDPDPNDIWVAAGVYTPDTNSAEPNGTSDRTATFQLISGVGLYGGFPSSSDPNFNDRDPNTHESILSGDLDGNDVEVAVEDLLTEPSRDENSYHVVTGGHTDANTTIDGFNITAGNADGSSSEDNGGGMYNTSGSPTVSNCTFSGNSADYGGGGMINEADSRPTVTNCTFSSNFGGGMCNVNSSPTVTNCTFSSNFGGGGMVNEPLSSPTVTNCTFIANSHGGMYNSLRSHPNVTNCAFIGNSGGSFGGGMDNSDLSHPTVTNCAFIGNSADEGGGMLNWESNATITNCAFIGNSADEGGAMNNWISGPAIANCTFSGNSAALTGRTMYNSGTSDPRLVSCILWGNSGAGPEIHNDGTSSADVSYSDVEGGWPGPGANNIDADPCFADPCRCGRSKQSGWGRTTAQRWQNQYGGLRRHGPGQQITHVLARFGLCRPAPG